MEFQIRTYEDRDQEALLEAWARALPLDALTDRAFYARVLGDRNLEPDGLIVAEAAGRAVGFALCLVLRHPIENLGLMEHRGFITAMGVHPDFQGRGIGKALLAEAEKFFRARGRGEITIAPYPPNYFVPGVDKKRYAAGLEFLEKQGFEEFVEAIAADALIGQFELAEDVVAKEEALRQEGLIVEPFSPKDMAAYIQFMAEAMPGDWVEDARGLVRRMASGDAPPDSIFVARDGGKIVGYCKFDGEHFGPFGVADSHQGRGIGSVLLARTLLQMRMEGHHSAYVLWTGERAAKGVYGRLGFQITRRFAVLKKTLD